MRDFQLTIIGCVALAGVVSADLEASSLFPRVQDGFEIQLYARDPMVRNPCAITFDARGRLTVGMGPQYRKPKPETPGDVVIILEDTDGDHIADSKVEFARGLNNIQGLLWKGGRLYIANAPDFTVVEDTTGDGIADKYTRLYSDLGNIEHGLHGLNWGPDGKLYMSKGNSKGLTQPPHRVAPLPFRRLWGLPDDVSLVATPSAVFSASDYKNDYHHPSDDWGRQGGVLRAHPDGSQLEIVSAGMRNPWDITYDDSFTWLGTDNDQNLGDKIFSPFYGAHFGWGHEWNSEWTDNKWTSVAPSGPLFEGSGAGITWWNSPSVPDPFRGVFLINDWMSRKIYAYKPKRDGTAIAPANVPFPVLAQSTTGRDMAKSSGESFDPVDIEIGPDGAVYVSSWGREYGSVFKDGEMVNEGRIYRIAPIESGGKDPDHGSEDAAYLDQSGYSKMRYFRTILGAIPGTHTQSALVEMQEDLIQLINTHKTRCMELMANPSLMPVKTKTWVLHAGLLSEMRNQWMAAIMGDSDTEETTSVIQTVNVMTEKELVGYAGAIRKMIQRSKSPQLLHAWILGGHRHRIPFHQDLIGVLDTSSDAHIYYSAWRALGAVSDDDFLYQLLKHDSAGVRRGALLALLEESRAGEDIVRSLTGDPDEVVRRIADKWLAGEDSIVIKGRPLLTSTTIPKSTVPDSESGELAEHDKVKEHLTNASMERGRALFLSESGAGCAVCHQLDGIGNNFAPSLLDIGSRASDDFLIQSILDPDASVTQGFHLTSLETHGGDVISGMLLRESGRGVTLAMMNGETIRVRLPEVADRTVYTASAMPGYFSALLSSRDVADIVAFLKTLKPSSGFATSHSDEGNHWAIRKNLHSLDFYYDDEFIMTYLTKHDEMTRPAFSNLHTVSGEPVTRKFPASEESDHRFMHPGLGVSFGWISGHDFWRMKAPVKTHSFIQEPHVDGHSLTFEVKNEYLGSDDNQTLVCHEIASYSLSVRENNIHIRWNSRFYNDNASFTFGDQEESGLALRIADDLNVRSGSGLIINDAGQINEKGTWGNSFNWITYSGIRNGKRLGMGIFPHPTNQRQSWSHSRDYGVLVANPFPKQTRSQRAPLNPTRINPGQVFNLQYHVVIFESDDPQAPVTKSLFSTR